MANLAIDMIAVLQIGKQFGAASVVPLLLVEMMTQLQCSKLAPLSQLSHDTKYQLWLQHNGVMGYEIASLWRETRG